MSSASRFDALVALAPVLSAGWELGANGRALIDELDRRHVVARKWGPSRHGRRYGRRWTSHHVGESAFGHFKREGYAEMLAEVDAIQRQTIVDLEDRADEILFEVVHGDIDRLPRGQPLFGWVASVRDEDGRVSDPRRSVDDRLLGETYAEMDIGTVARLEDVDEARIRALRRSAGVSERGRPLPDDRVPIPADLDASRPAGKRQTSLRRMPRVDRHGAAMDDEDPIDTFDETPFRGVSDGRGFDQNKGVRSPPVGPKPAERRSTKGERGTDRWLRRAWLVEWDQWHEKHGRGPKALDAQADELLKKRSHGTGSLPPDQTGRRAERRPEAAAAWLSLLSGLPLHELAEAFPRGRPSAAQVELRARLRQIVLYLGRKGIASHYDVATALGRSPRAIERLTARPAVVTTYVDPSPVQHETEIHNTATLASRTLASVDEHGVVGVLGGARGLFADAEDAD